AQRDPPDGRAGADARHPRRDRFGPRHRRAPHGLRGRQQPALQGPRDARHHPLPAAPELHRARSRPCPEGRRHRALGRQESRPRTRKDRIHALMDTVTTDARDLYVADFERIAKTLPGFADLRRKAIARFAERGFPTGREEKWRFTDTTPVTELHFKPASGTPNPNQFAGLAAGGLKALQIAFVDGRFAPAFSTLDLPPGVGVAGLADVLKSAPEVVAPFVLVPEEPFELLNTAFFRDGAAIRIGDGVTVDRPIHVLYLSSLHGDPYAMHPRTVISLGRGAKASVVVSYLGPSGGTYLLNTVTAAVLAEGASLDLTKVQRESPQAFHFESLDLRTGRG